MSLHIQAQAGEIAPAVLLAGDPLRARFIAESYLEDARCYNEVRNMLGYTGTYRGRLVSVQGTGMGMPSLALYAHELITEYEVQTLIRVGTCGSLQAQVNLRDLVLAQGACTDSSMVRRWAGGLDFAPLADFELLDTAYHLVKDGPVPVHVGNILASDTFYQEEGGDPLWRRWAALGVLAVEMETAALYALAAKYRRQALTVLTVSDSLVTGEVASAQEREQSYTPMIELGLEVALASLGK
ncbi:MAG: purine-nucleoside phosphorylase [Bacteroidetes bacterium]|nr:MAG: purine-nucleoside phosphorylase [Bacteroidota bacterium]